ncbi:MAG: phosphotransferase [Phycisphaerae bacterium]|nr:phosphotransferase [Phycisphaerae bacterium]
MTSDRERFSPSELAVVLSHYDVGVIESAKEFPRGSRQAPKLLLGTPRGRYLLKRRASGRDDPFKVAFSHALVAHLRDKEFPVPALIGTRNDQNSLLQLGGHVYELFEYVQGERYDNSLEQTTYSGLALARYHEAVIDFQTEWTPPAGSYHDADAVRNGLNAIPTTTASHDSVIGHEAELLQITQELYERYEEAAEHVNQGDFSSWPVTIIHGDWHPGNMLFRGNKICAVLDFDAARLQPSIIDLAYGMLQFSILRGTAGPDEWPDFGDESRTRRFMNGYLSRRTVPEAQRQALPDLMAEALIGETVLPIAVTGSFGRLPGFGVLQMIGRKVHWLLKNRERLLSWLLE